MSPPQNGVRRNTEIEEATNLYFIHPISARLVPVFARLGVHPNTVSLMGAVAGILAAVDYYFSHTAGWVLVGFALMIWWHIFDGADGQLARLTNKVTSSGFVIDGVCDYACFGAIYIAIAIRLTPAEGGFAWVLVAMAAASHAVQAAAFELQRETYIFWTSSIVNQSLEDLDRKREERRRAPLRSSILRGFRNYYDVIQRPFLPLPPEQELRLRAEVKAGRAEEVAALYRAIYRPAVNMWSLLSANNRTLIIFLAFLAGKPQGCPWFEVFVLNAILLALVGMNTALGRRVARIASFAKAPA